MRIRRSKLKALPGPDSISGSCNASARANNDDAPPPPSQCHLENDTPLAAERRTHTATRSTATSGSRRLSAQDLDARGRLDNGNGWQPRAIRRDTRAARFTSCNTASVRHARNKRRRSTSARAPRASTPAVYRAPLCGVQMRARGQRPRPCKRRLYICLQTITTHTIRM